MDASGSLSQSATPARESSSASSLTPVWLLDVDGVTNVARTGWGVPPHRATVRVEGTAYNVRWAPPLVAKIRALHRDGVVEVRWCTSWCPQARTLEAHMRLPEMATTLCEEDLVSREALNAAKLRVALHVVEVERRPLIWTDDEAIPLDGPDRARLENAGVPVHLVAPRANRGLRPEHLADIEMFAVAAASH